MKLQIFGATRKLYDFLVAHDTKRNTDIMKTVVSHAGDVPISCVLDGVGARGEAVSEVLFLTTLAPENVIARSPAAAGRRGNLLLPKQFRC